MAPSLSKAMGSPNTHPSPYRNTPRGAVQFTTPFPLQQAHPRDHSRKRHNHRRNTRPQHTTHQGDPHEQQPPLPTRQPATPTPTMESTSTPLRHLRASHRLHTQSTTPIQLRHRRDHPPQTRRHTHLRQPRTRTLVVQPHQKHPQPHLGPPQSTRTHPTRQRTTTRPQPHHNTNRTITLVRLTQHQTTTQGRTPSRPHRPGPRAKPTFTPGLFST